MLGVYVGEEHLPHPRVVLAEDLASTLDWHFTHQSHCEGIELLDKVLATLLPGWSLTVHLARLLRPPQGRAYTLTHTFLQTYKCRHCIGSTW
jgi:hypothetical protein